MQNNFSDMKQRSDRDRSDQLSLDFDSIPFFVEAYGQAVNSRTRYLSEESHKQQLGQ